MNREGQLLDSHERIKLLGLELVPVCEAAAIASARWVGRGDKISADAAATEAMRSLLNVLPMEGTVVIGEGELDEAPMLYIGEELGTGCGPAVDIAVDPLEGTSLVADGRENALSVIAAAPRGTLLHAPDMYMEKIAVGPAAAGLIDIRVPVLENTRRTAEALNKPLHEMTVAIQHRPRHQISIDELRDAGVKVVTFQEGDVSIAISTAVYGTGIDLFYGIGGAPEGVVAAVALKCLGGDMQGKLLPQNEQEAERCSSMGIADLCKPLLLDDFVGSDDCLFAATGITGSSLLDGVIKQGGNWVTHTMLAFGRKRQVYFIKNISSTER